MSKPCPPSKVRNPATGRCVKKDGALGKKILAASPKPARRTASPKPARRVAIRDLPEEMIEHTMSFMEPKDMISFLKGMNYSDKEVVSFLTRKHKIGNYRFFDSSQPVKAMYNNVRMIYNMNPNVNIVGLLELSDSSSISTLNTIDVIKHSPQRNFSYLEIHSEDYPEYHHIIINNTVTSIPPHAFTDYRYISLAGVDIPDSVTSIGDAAFQNCESLESIDIPDSVTSIGEQAFMECYALTKVKIPSGVTSISDRTFMGCESLTSVKIPSGVTSIGDAAFAGCESLTNVKIPDSVTSIGEGAFEGTQVDV